MPELPPAKQQDQEAAVNIEDIEALKLALEQEKKKADEYLNRLKYIQADFENFQRRTLSEMKAVSDSGVKRLVTELLPILDELDCALEAGRKMNGNKALVEGVALIRQKLLNILEKEGLTRIETVGKKLDPHKSEAVLKVKAEASKEGTVLEEIRAGYMFKGQVIRPSLVKVAVTE
ncbi:MAG: nucleotide exchange factor GrpE [Candidatus Bathyarchaeia archaeon]